MKKRAIVNFAASFAYQIINLLVGLILPKIYTEIFGSTYNGLNQSLTQIMGLFAVLQLGIAAVSIQQMFKHIADDNHDMVNAIYRDAAKQYRRMGYIFLTIVLPMVFLYPLVLNEELPYWIIVAFFGFRCVSAAMDYFFQAKYTIILSAYNKSYFIYLVNIVLVVFGAICHLAVLFTCKNILIYQMVAVLVAFVRMLIVGIYVKRKFPFLSSGAKAKYVPQKQAQRKHVLISEVAGIVIDSTDLVVLSTFSGLVSASIYSVYSFVTSGIGNILGSCREAVFAGIGKTFYENFHSFRQKMDRFESVYLAIVFCLYSVTVLLYMPFIAVYTENMDTEYVFAGLPILFILSRLIVNLRIPAIVAINAAGHFAQVKYYALIEAVINLVLSLTLVGKYGIYGVLVGTIIAALFRTPVLIWYSSKNICKHPMCYYWKKVLIWLPVFVASYLISVMTPLKCASLGAWVLVAIPTTVCVCVVCAVWMAIFDKDTFCSLYRTIFHKRERN